MAYGGLSTAFILDPIFLLVAYKLYARRHDEHGSCSPAQGEAAELALDNGFAALQLLASDYGGQVQRMREQRASHEDRRGPGVDFSVGQVFRHKACYCRTSYRHCCLPKP